MSEHKAVTSQYLTLNENNLDEGTSNPILDSRVDSFASQAKGKTGFKRILKATGYSIDGFKAAYKNEAAFRQVIVLNALLLSVLAVIPFALIIKMVLITGSFLSLIVELFNTAIEASVDHTSTRQHPLAKIAKDVGSAAQFLSLLLLFILWSLAVFTLK